MRIQQLLQTYVKWCLTAVFTALVFPGQVFALADSVIVVNRDEIENKTFRIGDEIPLKW
ncbi:MAG: hypothetical protein GF350_08335, partial [Chitinivibrionales bacterium]|nr:hypothetical protein [Chitinivibrionales bacterium]